MSADQVFGEIGLLTEQPRSATVEAVSDVSMLVLDREDFLALVGRTDWIPGRRRLTRTGRIQRSRL